MLGGRRVDGFSLTCSSVFFCKRLPPRLSSSQTRFRSKIDSIEKSRRDQIWGCEYMRFLCLVGEGKYCRVIFFRCCCNLSAVEGSNGQLGWDAASGLVEVERSTKGNSLPKHRQHIHYCVTIRTVNPAILCNQALNARGMNRSCAEIGTYSS